MRTRLLTAAAAAGLFSCVVAVGAEPPRPVTLTLRVTGACLLTRAELATAQATVARIFDAAGIGVVWLERKDKAAAPAMVQVRLVKEPMDHVGRRALAYTKPFARKAPEVTVAVDRVRRVAGRPELAPHLLGHALAHEIIHLLQGTDWHDETGVMKASWDRSDYRAMETGPLALTPADLALIRLGSGRFFGRR